MNITTSALQTAISGARSDLGLPADGGFGAGIPLTQLQQELATKSLADVATAHGKSAADIANALKNAAHQRIDQDVSSGRLTADQATQAKQQTDQRIDQLMTQVGLGSRQSGDPGGARRNPNGTAAPDGNADGATAAVTAG